MIIFKRTDSNDPDFLTLVTELDQDLRVRDGDDHVFYAQLNKTDGIPTCVVAYDESMPVGCGAIRPIPEVESGIEIKRMYVRPDRRGAGIASGVLASLEKWADELGYKKCLLETGRRQPEAIALYGKNGYHQIPNFGRYWNVENSVCFEKALSSS